MGAFDHLGVLRQSFNKTLTLSVLLIAVSQFNFGFDQQGFATTQAMDAFDREFGVWDPEIQSYTLSPVWLSLFNSLNYIGFGFGIILGSYVSKHFGRRMCMFAMSCWSLVAVTIVITSTSPDQIMAGRVFTYIYTGMELSVVPIFQAEIAPQKVRGFVVGSFQLSLSIGGLVINGVARGTGDIQSNAAWRIPVGLMYIVPTFVASCIWFIPESPRWLVIKNRQDQAHTSLTRLRSGKFTSEEIDAELLHILSGISQEQEKGVFLDIFRGRSNRIRTMIVMGCSFFLQGTGQIFASVYGALFVKSLETVNPFTITIVNACINIAIGIVAMILVDKLGRRAMLMIGGAIQAAALMTMGGLGTIADPSNTVKGAIIAMMSIFSSGYAFGWAPIVHTLSAEIPSMKLRDLTYRTASVLNVVIQFTVSFSLPYLLYPPYAALGAKVGFIYGSIAVLSIVFAFFCVPDLHGRSLEEVDKLFASGVSLRHFNKTHVAVIDNEDAGSDLKAGAVIHVDRKDDESA